MICELGDQRVPAIWIPSYGSSAFNSQSFKNYQERDKDFVPADLRILLNNN